jgi:hypothetical protein
MGFPYGATGQTVQNALRRRTKNIIPTELCLLLLSYGKQERDQTRTVGRRGHFKGFRMKDTERRIELAATLRSQGVRGYALAKSLYPLQHDKNTALDTSRKFLKRYRV